MRLLLTAFSSCSSFALPSSILWFLQAGSGTQRAPLCREQVLYAVMGQPEDAHTITQAINTGLLCVSASQPWKENAKALLSLATGARGRWRWRHMTLSHCLFLFPPRRSSLCVCVSLAARFSTFCSSWSRYVRFERQILTQSTVTHSEFKLQTGPVNCTFSSIY